MKHYTILVLCWFTYFFLHSFLASDGVKKFLKVQHNKIYRLGYSVIASIGLLFLLFMNGAGPTLKIFDSEGIIRYFSMMLATIGVIVIRQAFKQYSLKSFIGLTRDEEEFKMEGILKRMRHPLYTGTILIVIGFFLFSPTISTLISTICILLYLPIGIYLEEKKLIKEYGDRYLNYKKEVPMLFPKFK